MAEKKPTVAQYEEKARIRRQKIRTMLKTDEGKALIEELEVMFDGALVKKYEGRGVDLHQTLINVGARTVVHHLRSVRDGKDGDES